MSDPARRTRRVIGLAFLASAILLLFVGQTILRHELHGARFALYWLACLLLVGMAMMVALLDLLAIRHQARRQQLHLLQNTLSKPGTSRPTSTDRVSGARQDHPDRAWSPDPEPPADEVHRQHP